MDHAFSLAVPLARLSAQGAPYRLAATPAQCLALAERFGLESIDELSADLSVRRTGSGAEAQGQFAATVVQRCVVSGVPLPARIHQPITLHFAPAPPPDASDIELEADEADTILIEGDSIDLADAVAQSLLLALDAWPRADAATLAEARRRLLSEEEAAARHAAEQASASPFAILKRPATEA